MYRCAAFGAVLLFLGGCRDATPAPTSPTPPAATPLTDQRPLATTFTAVSAGADHACALAVGGVAYCWGDNTSGQLGLGSTSDHASPQPVSGSLTFRAISVGARHTCAVTTTNLAYCWGSDVDGQLGAVAASTCATGVCALVPVPVNGNRSWSLLDAGALHTCGVDAAGTAFCWGDNTFGAIGDGGSTPRRHNPYPVAGGGTWSAITAGLTHSCAVSTSGMASCWGSNAVGQLGGTASQVCASVPCSLSPIAVTGGTTFAQIDAGAEHSCAVSTGQVAMCWGANRDHQLGDDTRIDRAVPAMVATALRFTTVSAGRAHSCAIDVGGAAHCWGTGAALGAGATLASGTPFPVAGSQSWMAVRAGADHSCGIALSGTASCWGSESDGELGDGGIAVSTVNTPVPLYFPPTTTTITSAASGFWDQGSTWVGGITPGPGDRVAIGAHTITVRDSRVVGDSPVENSGTFAIDFTSTSGALIVDGASLTVRGDIRNRGGNTVATQVTVQSNGASPGVLEFDASLAAAPATTNYRVVLMRGNTQFAKWRLLGSPTARVQVRSHPGGGEAYFTRAGFVNGGNFEADFTTFTRMGNATQPVYDFWLGNDGRNEMRLRDVIFDTCGRLNATAHSPHAGADLEFRRVLWKNTTHPTHSVHLGPGPAANGATFVDSDPDKRVMITDASHWTLDGTLFHGGLDVAGTGRWTSAANVLLRSTTIASATQTAGDVVNWYVLKDGVGVNPHGISPRDGTGSALIDGVIFDYAGGSNVGDLVNLGAMTVPTPVTVRRAILLPNASGGQMGKLVSILGRNTLVTAEHNTIWSDGSRSNLESGVVAYGETYAGVDGMIVSVRSNLVLGAVPGGGVVLTRNPTSSVQLSDPSIASHNAMWQALLGTDGPGYHAFGVARPPIFPTGAPGANDLILSALPVVDPMRNMKTWDASLGGPGTYAHALAELRKRNDASGFIAGYTLSNLRAYIEDGFRPTAESLRAAAHDGGTVGAVPMLPNTP